MHNSVVFALYFFFFALFHINFLLSTISLKADFKLQTTYGIFWKKWWKWDHKRFLRCDFNENTNVVTDQYLQSTKTLLTLELRQYLKSGSAPAKWACHCPAAAAADSETPCVCACPSYPPKLCQRAAPRAQQLILPSKESKPLITFWNSLWSDCQLTDRGSALTWTQIWTPDQRIMNALFFRNHKINLIEPSADTISCSNLSFTESRPSGWLIFPGLRRQWRSEGDFAWR